MDRGAWWATVHGGHKESETTERLTLSLPENRERRKRKKKRLTLEPTV